MTALQDFAATSSAVFGDAIDAQALWGEIIKMSPGPEAVHSPGVLPSSRGPRSKQPGALVVRRKPVAKKEMPAGLEEPPNWKRNTALATNAAGAVLGPAAIATAFRSRAGGGMPRAAMKMTSKLKPNNPIARAGLALDKPATKRQKKIAALAGGALVAGQTANFGGDVIAAQEMNRQRKVANWKATNKKPESKQTVDKALPSIGAMIRGHRKVAQQQVASVLPKANQGAAWKTAAPSAQGTKAVGPKGPQTARMERKAQAGALKRTKAGAVPFSPKPPSTPAWDKGTRMGQQAPKVVQRAGGNVGGRIEALQASQKQRMAAAAQARPTPAQTWTQRGQGARQDFNAMAGTTSGKVALGGAGVMTGMGMLKRRNANAGGGGGYDPYAGFGKGDRYDAKVGFSKFDEDKRLAFGWASVVKKNGLPVLDRQGDYIGIDDVEDAAYVYVEKSRVGGHMHQRATAKSDNEDRPHHVADMVESMVFTPEKIAKMGLPEDFPTGWWVGYRVFDDDVWAKAKSGELTGFSIHGKGIRKSVNYDELMGAGR